jgi:hypothetical protein
VQYTAEEIPLVVSCISAMNVALNVSKESLGIMTIVCDKICELTHDVNQPDATASAAESGIPELELASQEWTARLLRGVEKVHDAVTDLGAELYPPDLEGNNMIPLYYRALKDRLNETINILQEEQFMLYQSTSQLESIVSANSALERCVLGMIDSALDNSH